jgi:predicted MPP superfamily phosphohydrolase
MNANDLTWILFRVMMTTVLALGVFYVGKRLHAIYPASPTYRWGVWVALIGFLALQFFSPFMYRQRDPSVLSWGNQALLWSSFTLLGFFAMLAFTFIGIDLISWVFQGAVRMKSALGFPDEELSTERRQFLSSVIPLSILAGSGVASSIGLAQARSTPKIQETEVPIAGLHPDLDGLRIAQISDLHIGQTIDREFVEAVVQATMSAQPDLIALTGDFVDGFVPVLREWAAPLAKLQAPLGVHYSPGNHEYYWGLDEWLEEFKRLGANVLVNQHTHVEKGTAKLLITGLADHQGKRMNLPEPDITRATENASAHDFHLLLSHQPKGYQQADEIAERHPVHLQLSGHTHAGQFFPVSLVHPFVHRYWRGLNRHTEKTWVYVCSGTGYWGPPNRFGVPSEVALLKLKRV